MSVSVEPVCGVWNQIWCHTRLPEGQQALCWGKQTPLDRPKTLWAPQPPQNPTSKILETQKVQKPKLYGLRLPSIIWAFWGTNAVRRDFKTLRINQIWLGWVKMRAKTEKINLCLVWIFVVWGYIELKMLVWQIVWDILFVLGSVKACCVALTSAWLRERQVRAWSSGAGSRRMKLGKPMKRRKMKKLESLNRRKKNIRRKLKNMRRSSLTKLMKIAREPLCSS